VAKLAAHLLATGSSLGLNPDIFQKYKMGDISKGVAKKARQKIGKKKDDVVKQCPQNT
jgi:hypothetical protein